MFVPGRLLFVVALTVLVGCGASAEPRGSEADGSRSSAGSAGAAGAGASSNAGGAAGDAGGTPGWGGASGAASGTGGASAAGGTAGASGGGGSGSAPQPLVVTPAMFVGTDQPLVVVTDGDPIALSLPQQGGHVLFAGAIVKHLRTSTVIVRGQIRDKDTGAIVATESRTVVMQPVPGDADSQQSDIRTNSQVSNVAVCPNYLPRAIDGETYLLEVTVTELYVNAPQSVTATRLVVPTCAKGTPDSALCSCECAGGYVLGKCPPSKG